MAVPVAMNTKIFICLFIMHYTYNDGYIIPLNVPDVPAQLDYLGLVVTAKHSRISKVIWMMSRRLSSRIITPLLLA